jgi:hypothetical protein
MADGPAASGQDAVANRALWTRVNAEYADEHAFRAWAAEEITWGSSTCQRPGSVFWGRFPG